ncbi:putative reverse transcriptase domain-containing protein [Tanacetum coccineum]
MNTAGALVRPKGMTVNSNLKNWKPPKTPTEIRSFLGLAGYYKLFSTNFLKISKPLTLLTQKDKKFKYGDEQENAFHTLKDMLCDALILALSEGTNDFVVYCDASNQGKENVVADALSMKDWMKPRRARAMSMAINSSIKAKILEVYFTGVIPFTLKKILEDQREASKGVNTPAEKKMADYILLN